MADVETETLGVEVDLVVALLQDGGNGLGVVELTQVNVRPALLDSVTDELGGTGLTLGSDDHGLLLLPGLVNDEGGTLGVLLSNLLGFDSGGELGRESKVLGISLAADRLYMGTCMHTVNETSSRRMLKRAALRTRLSLTSLDTFSLCVIN